MIGQAVKTLEANAVQPLPDVDRAYEGSGVEVLPQPTSANLIDFSYAARSLRTVSPQITPLIVKETERTRIKYPRESISSVRYLSRVHHVRDKVGPRVSKSKREVLDAYPLAIENSSGKLRNMLVAAYNELRNNQIHYRMDGHSDFNGCVDEIGPLSGRTYSDGYMVVCRKVTRGSDYELAATIAHEPLHRVPKYNTENNAQEVERAVMKCWRK